MGILRTLEAVLFLCFAAFLFICSTGCFIYAGWISVPFLAVVGWIVILFLRASNRRNRSWR